MRTGISVTYEFCTVSDRGTVVAVFGAGRRMPDASSTGARGARTTVIEETRDSFAFYAALGPKMLPKGGADVYAVLERFGGDFTLFREYVPDQYRISKTTACACRIAPTWPIAAEVERLFMLEVHGKKPDSLKFVEPPAIWARELPVLSVFALVQKEK